MKPTFANERSGAPSWDLTSAKQHTIAEAWETRDVSQVDLHLLRCAKIPRVNSHRCGKGETNHRWFACKTWRISTSTWLFAGWHMYIHIGILLGFNISYIMYLWKIMGAGPTLLHIYRFWLLHVITGYWGWKKNVNKVSASLRVDLNLDHHPIWNAVNSGNMIWLVASIPLKKC